MELLKYSCGASTNRELCAFVRAGRNAPREGMFVACCRLVFGFCDQRVGSPPYGLFCPRINKASWVIFVVGWYTVLYGIETNVSGLYEIFYQSHRITFIRTTMPAQDRAKLPWPRRT